MNGIHACQNKELLTTHLKGTMEFGGWVMSNDVGRHRLHAV